MFCTQVSLLCSPIVIFWKLRTSSPRPGGLGIEFFLMPNRRVCDQKGEPSKKDATVTVGGDGNGAGTQLAKDSRMEDRVGPIPTVQREAIVSSNFGTGHNSPSGQGNRFQGEMSSRVTSEMISDISISSNNLTQEHYQIDELELTVTDKN